MDTIFVMPLITSILSLIFAITVLDQFFARRKPYQLVWAIGLFMYFIGAGSEFWTEAYGLNETAYKLWYLFGAVMVAAYLGLGTVYLLVPRRSSHIIMVVLLIASIYAAVRVFLASPDISSLQNLSGQAMPDAVRRMTPVFNALGTIALVGGAGYSAWVFWKRKVKPHRMISNILIAVGAIMPAAGGTAMRLSGALLAFYTLELLGIIIIFAGFLRSREVFGFYRFPLIHGFRRMQSE